MGQGSIIGYEINEKTCQISYYNDTADWSRQTLEADTENFQIPLPDRKTQGHLGIWKRGKTSGNTERMDLRGCPTTFEQESGGGENCSSVRRAYDAVWLLAQYIQMSLQSFGLELTGLCSVYRN